MNTDTIINIVYAAVAAVTAINKFITVIAKDLDPEQRAQILSQLKTASLSLTESIAAREAAELEGKEDDPGEP